MAIKQEEENSLNSSKNSQNGWSRRVSTPASSRVEKMEKIQRKGVIEFSEEKPKNNRKSKLCLILWYSYFMVAKI